MNLSNNFVKIYADFRKFKQLFYNPKNIILLTASCHLMKRIWYLFLIYNFSIVTYPLQIILLSFLHNLLYYNPFNTFKHQSKGPIINYFNFHISTKLPALNFSKLTFCIFLKIFIKLIRLIWLS